MNLIKKLLRLFWLNILWLIGCIPVITIGVSICAAYAVTLRLADDDEEVKSFGGIARRFFKAYKQDFLQGILILIFTAACGAGGYFIFKAFQESGFNLIKIAVLAGYALLAFVFNMYSYPLISRYSNTFLNTLRNSVALFLQYVNSNLKTLGIVVLELVILYFTRYTFFAGFIILPSLIFYTVSRTAKDIFVRLENPAPAEDGETPDSAEGDEEDTDEDEKSADSEEETSEPEEEKSLEAEVDENKSE